MKDSLTNALLYFLTVLIWGTTWTAIKLQLGWASPELSIFYRFALASSFLLLYCKIKKLNLRFTLKEHISLCLLGFCMFSFHMVFIYLASQYLISGLVSIIFSFTSVFNIANNFIFFKKKPEMRVLIGVAIGLLGIVLFFLDEIRTLSWQSQTFFGLILALMGTLLFSFGNTIASRNQNQKTRLIPSTTIAMGYGTVIMFCYCLQQKIPFIFPSSSVYWSSLLYLVVLGSIVAFLCYLRLISRIGPEKAGYATLFFPLIALLFSLLFENYSLSIKDLFGMAFVLMGNFLVLQKKKLFVRFNQL